jgi:hypothetical protein
MSVEMRWIKEEEETARRRRRRRSRECSRGF